jgi:hypothetical protein
MYNQSSTLLVPPVYRVICTDTSIYRAFEARLSGVLSTTPLKMKKEKRKIQEIQVVSRYVPQVPRHLRPHATGTALPSRTI